jgi:hypothetical protein
MRSPASASTIAEDAGDLVELLLLRHERGRDLDDRITAVVGVEDEAALEEPRRKDPRRRVSTPVVVETLAGVLTLAARPRSVVAVRPLAGA